MKRLAVKSEGCVWTGRLHRAVQLVHHAKVPGWEDENELDRSNDMSKCPWQIGTLYGAASKTRRTITVQNSGILEQVYVLFFCRYLFSF